MALLLATSMAAFGPLATAAGDDPTTLAALAPRVIYAEDFENVGTLPANTPRLLTDYTGATGVAYTAANYWLAAGYCNGFITNASIHPSNDRIADTYCGWNRSAWGQGWNGTGAPRGDYDAVRAKAFTLGLLRGNSAATNFALSTNTSGGLPSADWNIPGSIMFSTPNATIPLPAERFIVFAVDAASTNCDNDARMRFEYVRDGNTVTVPSTDGLPITACTSPGTAVTDVKDRLPWRQGTRESEKPTWVTEVHYGTFHSSTFQSGTSNSPIRLILRNTSSASSEAGRGIANNPLTGQAGQQDYVAGRQCDPAGACQSGTANGNDGAIDNVQILDVTPGVEKTFDPVRVPVGGESTMTLTIKNRADLNEKDGWSFVDTLPAGLKFKNATVGGTCAAMGKQAGNGQPTTRFTVNVNAGTLTATRGVLAANAETCTITATVTSTDAQTFYNGPTAYHPGQTPSNPNADVQDPNLPAADRNDAARTFNRWSYIDPPNDAHVTFYPWVKLQKNVASRVNDTDRFKLDITGPTVQGSVTSGSKTTTSTGNGLQTPVVGAPEFVELVPGQNYTLTETGAGNPAADLDLYNTSLSCATEDAPGTELLPNGPITGTTGSLNGPGTPSGNAPGTANAKNVAPVGHKSLICTFTNEPAKTTVTITKKVQDSNGANEAPRAGWTVGAQAQATAGGVTQTPASATQQTGSDGSASWQLALTGSNPTASVTVSEVPQDDFEFVSGSCEVTPRSGQPRTVPLTGSDPQAVTGVKAGDTVACTYVNKLKPATVTIGKQLQGTNNSLTPAADWTVGATLSEPANGVAITGPATAKTQRTHGSPTTDGFVATPWTVDFSHTLTVRTADVRVQETMQAGYAFVSAECTVTGRGDRTVELDSVEGVLGDLKPGEQARCVFVNTMHAAPFLPLTGGLGRDAFFIAGAGILLLGLGGAVALQLRNRRRTMV